MRGVISIPVIMAGTSQDVILNRVCQKVIKKDDCFKYEDDLKRTVDWYKTWTRGQDPIIILSANNCRLNEKPADLAVAARYLRDHLKFKVLIDASENALQKVILTKKKKEKQGVIRAFTEKRLIKARRNIVNFVTKYPSLKEVC
jgi:hypothetical protein